MGALKAGDRSTMAIQDNNAYEQVLKAVGFAHWLETCGPTAVENGCGAVGYDVDSVAPGVQFSDHFTSIVNNPHNWAKLSADSGLNVSALDRPRNEYRQLYPAVLRMIFPKGRFEYWPASDFDVVRSAMDKGCSAVAGLNEPKHFICFVDYQAAADTLVLRDSWGGRTGTDGFNLPMNRAEFVRSVPDGAQLVPLVGPGIVVIYPAPEEYLK